MVVLEILGSGKNARFERVEGMPVSIGRALNNDVIVDDPYVDPHHLSLDDNESKDGWVAIDLSSTNHTVTNRTVKEHSPADVTAVESGDVLQLGKTRIRVYSENHAVAPTLSLRDLEHRLLDFDAIKWVVALIAALLCVVCLQMYLASTVDAIKPVTYATTAITLLASVVFVGGFWGLISRIMKGDTRFAPLVNITLVQAMVAIVFTLFLNVLYFNFPGMAGKETFQNIASLVFFVTYVYLCLVLTTRLNLLPKVVVCSAIVIGTLGFMAISDYSQEDQFVYYPKYDGALYTPYFLVRSGVSEDDFRASLPMLFDQSSRMVSAEK
jgi:hypothetical protein